LRILFVSERFPYPLNDGGNLRTYHILHGLAREHDVHLVAHDRPDLDEPAVDALREICAVTIVPKPPRWRCLLSGRIVSESLFVARNWSDTLLAAVDELRGRESFDVIHFNHLDTACYALHRSWDEHKVFDTHNCLSIMAGEMATQASSWLRPVYQRETSLLDRVERAVCSQMDAVLACSQDEAAAFSRLGAAGVVVAPNGVDCRHFQKLPAVAEEPGTIVFTGAMGYFPNADAATYLCRDVLPNLTDLDPQPKVYLVGKDPPPAVQALHNGQSVLVTGRVDDIRPYLQRATLVVVPLRYGAGTRLKILEAFAMGKPVVSTYKGAEGIPAIDGEEILLAGDSLELAAQIRRAWLNPALRVRLAAAAQRFVRRFDWPQVQNVVLQAYERLHQPALAIA
jgi:sugar transferase (PEP-CTERM/EpsH1 system associated)